MLVYRDSNKLSAWVTCSSVSMDSAVGTAAWLGTVTAKKTILAAVRNFFMVGSSRFLKITRLRYYQQHFPHAPLLCLHLLPPGVGVEAGPSCGHALREWPQILFKHHAVLVHHKAHDT